MLQPLTNLAEIGWPAVPAPAGAMALSLLFQLEQSQWQSSDELQARQREQLHRVARHAYETVSYYRQRFDAAGLKPACALNPEQWLRLPLLGRRDVQLAGPMLHSSQIPTRHGRVGSLTTSGSTGAAVTALTTEVTQMMWRVLTIRDHLWHRRELGLSFAAIRHVKPGVANYPAGYRADSWGTATDGIVATGPAYLLTIDSTVDEQAEWLSRVNPHYLLSYPSVLKALANHFDSRPEASALSNLREVRSFGEILEPACRAACRRAWNVNVVDMYSAQETGYLALQCPESDHYHVQAENVLAEVLDDAGNPCRPGEIGRLVISTLHNFAMPLLRYDIGDFAEVGDDCPCGRRLPVLKRILGRQRNLLCLPGGQRRWPSFGQGDQREGLPPILQFQIIQTTLHEVEVKIVTLAALTSDDEATVKAYVQQMLGHPFDVTILCVDEIPRSPSGKFEDFISRVDRECVNS